MAWLGDCWLAELEGELDVWLPLHQRCGEGQIRADTFHNGASCFSFLLANCLLAADREVYQSCDLDNLSTLNTLNIQQTWLRLNI